MSMCDMDVWCIYISRLRFYVYVQGNEEKRKEEMRNSNNNNNNRITKIIMKGRPTSLRSYLHSLVVFAAVFVVVVVKLLIPTTLTVVVTSKFRSLAHFVVDVVAVIHHCNDAMS